MDECLRRLLATSNVQLMIMAFGSEDHQQEVVKRYLHDFVHMIYQPIVEGEDEVGMSAIYVLCW